MKNYISLLAKFIIVIFTIILSLGLIIHYFFWPVKSTFTSSVSGPMISSKSYNSIKTKNIELLKKNMISFVKNSGLYADKFVLSSHDIDLLPAMTKRTDNLLLETSYNYAMFANDKGEIGKDFWKVVVAHEYGHYISLQDSEIQKLNEYKELNLEEFNIQEKNCEQNYYNIYGCFKSDSLLSKYKNQFWKGGLLDQYNKIQNENQDSEKFNKALQDFYKAHQETFINLTSVENLEEDFADVFGNWIVGLNNYKDTPAIKEKLQFMESQPELVELKKQFNIEFDKAFGQ
jgi:hypothetical protein